jgi:hypothetical protein
MRHEAKIKEKLVLLIVSCIVTFGLLALWVNDGAMSDMSEPHGAIEFAYAHMSEKDNVTFIKIEQNPYQEWFKPYWWVTDTEGTTYRLVWSSLHHQIKLNKPYHIKYDAGMFNALWEVEAE